MQTALQTLARRGPALTGALRPLACLRIDVVRFSPSRLAMVLSAEHALLQKRSGREPRARR